MKTIVFFLTVLCSITGLWANENEELDTIYGNEKMNTALFFPSQIRQGIGGAEHIIFSYNRETEQDLGLLKVLPGEESNLLVITKDGRVYSYIVKYAKKLKRLNYFINTGDALEREKKSQKQASREIVPKVKTKENREILGDMVMSKENNNLHMLKNSCVSLLKLPERRNIRRTKGGISLALKNKVYHENMVYLQFEISNRSGIDLDIGHLRISKIKGNKKRKSSYQELVMNPIYIHNMPKVVRHGETVRFVQVLPKFRTAKKESVHVVLYGNDGDRHITLKWK